MHHFVHTALNVYSLDYALKLLSCNRTMEQSNKPFFFVLFCFLVFFCLVWELLSQWKRNNVFIGGEIVLVFTPNKKRFLDSVHFTLSVVHYIVLT